MKRQSKTYDFIVVLEEHAAYKYIDWISRLMLLMAMLSFLWVAYLRINLEKAVDPGGITFLLMLIPVLIAGWWAYCYRQSKRGQVPYYRFGLLLAAWGWFLYPNGGYIYILYLVAAILEKPVKILPEVAFDAHEIVFNSFPKKTLHWADINNVILKEGILTIDCKNNKLIQRTVNEEISDETEKEFNEFCEKAKRQEIGVGS